MQRKFGYKEVLSTLRAPPAQQMGWEKPEGRGNEQRGAGMELQLQVLSLLGEVKHISSVFRCFQSHSSPPQSMFSFCSPPLRFGRSGPGGRGALWARLKGPLWGGHWPQSKPLTVPGGAAKAKGKGEKKEILCCSPALGSSLSSRCCLRGRKEWGWVVFLYILG